MTGSRMPRRVPRAVIERVMTSTAVRDALAARARQIAARANGLAAREGVEVDATVREGTRPRGRPFAYVESKNRAQEYGDETTARLRILGRAGHGG